MNKIATFYQLPSKDRWLMVHVAVQVAVVRLGLTLLPFRIVYRLIPRRPSSRDAKSPVPPQRFADAVRVIAPYVPRASCLTQALATRALLSRHGYTSELRLGVARAEAGAVEAHAWLVCDGTVIIGGEAVENFTPLPPFRGQ